MNYGLIKYHKYNSESYKYSFDLTNKFGYFSGMSDKC